MEKRNREDGWEREMGKGDGKEGWKRGTESRHKDGMRKQKRERRRGEK